MHTVLRNRFDRLERARREVEQEAAHLSAEQAAFRPSPDAWNVAEVIDHVVRVESSVLEGASRSGVNRTRWKSRPVRRALTWVVFTAGLRIRVPQRVKHVTPAREASLADALERWSVVRVRMERFLSELAPEQLDQLAVKHPLAGPFSYRNFLMFLEWHLRHHRRQLTRIRRTPGFPG